MTTTNIDNYINDLNDWFESNEAPDDLFHNSGLDSELIRSFYKNKKFIFLSTTQLRVIYKNFIFLNRKITEKYNTNKNAILLWEYLKEIITTYFNISDYGLDKEIIIENNNTSKHYIHFSSYYLKINDDYTLSIEETDK